MNREQVDAFLADADDVITDWEGSDDAAAWSADGAHEVEISGQYYGADYPGAHDSSSCLACTLAGNVSLRFDLMGPLSESATRQLDMAERLLGYELEPWQRNFILRALAYSQPVVAPVRFSGAVLGSWSVL